MDIPISAIKPIYHPTPPPSSQNPTTTEPAAIQKTIQTLHLLPHIEGGYFAETDRDPLRIPNPFISQQQHHHHPTTTTTTTTTTTDNNNINSTRSASTSIFYFLTPKNPLGAFHRNRARTVHTLHRGRGRYVIIHADEVEHPTARPDTNDNDSDTSSKVGKKGKARIETFVVGHDIVNGEKLQWVVEGGRFKASFLLPDSTTGSKGDGEEESGGSQGLLISETVVPGFEYSDHDFLRAQTMEELLTPEQVEELNWMLRKVD